MSDEVPDLPPPPPPPEAPVAPDARPAVEDFSSDDISALDDD